MLTQNELEKQLNFNMELIKRLKPYFKRQARYLPDDILKDLNKIQIGPNITTSGLEKVNTILKNLYIANFYLEEALKNREAFQKIYSRENKNTSSIPKKPVDTKIDDETASTQTQPKNNPTLNSQQPIKIVIEDNAKNKPDNNLPPENNHKYDDHNAKNKSHIPPPSSTIKL